MREEGKAKPLPELSKDRHRYSDFFLKHILKSKQGGHAMTGKRHGRNGEKRSYRVPLAARCPQTDSVLNRAINATALEKEMLKVLREVLLSKPDLKEALRRAASSHAHKHQPLDDRPQIEKALLRRQKQIAAALENLSGEDELDRPIENKLAEYRAEVARLTAALRLSPTPRAPVNIDQAAEQLTTEFVEFGSNLDDKDNAIIHELFGLLIHKMEADLVTKEIDIELAIPSWIGSAMRDGGMMSLVGAFAWCPAIPRPQLRRPRRRTPRISSLPPPRRSGRVDTALLNARRYRSRGAASHHASTAPTMRRLPQSRRLHHAQL
jgi:hypothetical protein